MLYYSKIKFNNGKMCKMILSKNDPFYKNRQYVNAKKKTVNDILTQCENGAN